MIKRHQDSKTKTDKNSRRDTRQIARQKKSTRECEQWRRDATHRHKHPR